MTGSHAPLEVGMPRTDHGAYDRLAEPFELREAVYASGYDTFAGAVVRHVMINGEPWFVLADIVVALGLSRSASAVVDRLDDEVRQTYPIRDRLGREQRATVVSEPGVYEVVIRSDAPAARDFRRWLMHDVIPSIRRTGSYSTTPAAPVAMSEDEIVHQALAITARRVQALEAKVAEDAPKVEAYDALMDADGYYSMESAAKMCGIGRNTLYRRLREAGVIQPGSTLPYQKHMHHFVLTAGSWTDREGNVHPTQTTRVRPSGLPFVMRKAEVTP
ncbi:prophage antirepressor-like protein [Microbacterium trichothecenolyticum]|uniref:phage antirepressor KilAC domain-containing protein n=1 Tax=Microbacterium trichothecenolyticum TaxID=69370 RepID=UPI0028624B52|nr:phage antirepressor KilAC domain-containing protein [Microbacterium trichothecenolyticum]MDR7113919.1 prophage antirepressor-like protein [Microbacterium trichothecenolyticum]